MPEHYTIADLAEAFGVARGTVWRWAREGQLAGEHDPEGRVRFSLDAVLEFRRRTGRDFAEDWRPWDRQILTAAEAGAMFRVQPGTIKRWLAQGHIEGFRTPGGHIRIYRDSLERHLRPQ